MTSQEDPSWEESSSDSSQAEVPQDPTTQDAPQDHPQEDPPAPSTTTTGSIFVQPAFPAPPAEQYELYLQCKAQEKATQARLNYNAAMTKINKQFVAHSQAKASNPSSNISRNLSTSNISTNISTTSHAGNSGNGKAAASVQLPKRKAPPKVVPKPAPIFASATTSAPTSGQLDRWMWPDGDTEDFVPASNLKSPGVPHFGYSLVHQNTAPPTKMGTVRRRFWCLGVHKCVVHGQ